MKKILTVAVLLLSLFAVFSAANAYTQESMGNNYASPNIMDKFTDYIGERWWLAIIITVAIMAIFFFVFKSYNRFLLDEYNIGIINGIGIAALIVVIIYGNLPFILMFMGWLEKTLNTNLGTVWFNEHLNWLISINSIAAYTGRTLLVTSPFLIWYFINAFIKTRSVLHAILATIFLLLFIPLFLYLVQMIIGLIIMVVIFKVMSNAAFAPTPANTQIKQCPRCGRILRFGGICNCE